MYPVITIFGQQSDFQCLFSNGNQHGFSSGHPNCEEICHIHHGRHVFRFIRDDGCHRLRKAFIHYHHITGTAV